MKRRDFIALLGGAATWPLVARAQQGERMRRIGVLNPFAENVQEEDNLKAFRQALQKLSWNDGHSVRIDYRWSGADPARIRAHAKELVGLNPDVIVVSTALALRPCNRRRAASRSFLPGLSIPSRPASSPAWRARAATSPASLRPNIRCSGNCWTCSRSSRLASRAWRSFSIRTRPRRREYCAHSKRRPPPS